MIESWVSRRRSLAGPLVVCALCVVAIAPLLRTDSPCTHDGGPNYYRVVAIGHAVQSGILFTRYLPDLAFGYGSPFFNYRAAFPYYQVTVLHLAGLALPLAMNLVYVLALVGSAIAAYLLARDLFGFEAGIIAAVAYVYVPYQLGDAFLRGNLPESVALPLLPLILWAFRRLVLTGRKRWFVISVVSLATLYLTHNISSLLFTPFLAVYLFVLWRAHRRKGYWAITVSAFVLALGLSAFFWGPALLEKGYVQLRMTHITRNNDFHNNFVRLSELLSLPVSIDTALMNPPMVIQLGLAQSVLGGAGLCIGLLRWRDRERRAMLVLFALATVLMVWMSTRASLWLWERVPLLRFVQFPWRFVGRAALPLAMLVGATASLKAQRTQSLGSVFRNVALSTVVIVLILAAFPSTYPPQGYCPNSSRPIVTDIFDYEHRTKRVGLAATGAFFPTGVVKRPESSPLEEQYSAGEPIVRFDEGALPSGASVVEADYGPNRAHIVVETPTAFTARYWVFYFPGWRVWVDGKAEEIRPSDPEGFITFEVPAGHHAIEVRFTETLLRLTADTVSFLSLVGFIVFAIRYPRPQVSSSPLFELPTFSFSVLQVVTILATVFLLIVFKLAIVDQFETPFRRSGFQPGVAPAGVEHVFNQLYADGLTLIGYSPGQATSLAERALRFDLYWTAHTQPSARYQSVIHLVGSDGMRWSLPDTFRPRGYAKYPPSTTWSPNHYALDSQEVEPLPGTPPGDYDVVLTTFDRDTLVPLSVLNEQGQPDAPDLLLGQVTLAVPRRSTDPDQLGIRNRLDARLGPLTLLGADFDRNEAASGDPVFVTTFWRAEERPVEDLTLQLELFASDGSVVTRYDFSPAPPWYPRHRWQPGDVWRGQHLFHLPAALDTGDYTWRIPDLQSPVTDFHITAPDRTLTPPPVDLEIGTRLGNTATLLGASLEPETLYLEPNATLTVTLVWRAEAETHISYRVFLHLIGPDDRLLAQSDGIPANWTRPTTGWLPGEYIADTHALTIPPDAPEGDYGLSTGLYTPGSERLVTPDGSDAISFAMIAVERP